MEHRDALFIFSNFEHTDTERGDAMIYLQMKDRVILEPGEQLKIRHVADVFGTTDRKKSEYLDLPLKCPASPGIWKIPAIHAAESLIAVTDDTVVPMGSAECYVHYIPKKKQNRVHVIRSVFAFLLLMIGSMLAITWFHADVNMEQAQRTLFRLITGKEIENKLMLTVPYAIGVFFGISLFYALLGRKGTISPLDIKQGEYHATSEKAAGKTP